VRNVLCKHLDGKVNAELNAAIHRELKDSLLPECDQEKEEDAPHSRRRKRNSNSDDGSGTSKREATEKSRLLSVYVLRQDLSQEPGSDEAAAVAPCFFVEPPRRPHLA
jgi:hypothetical protein